MRFYSKWLTVKVLVLDERRSPPSITQRDDKDFVPLNKWVVYGHHFAAIARPGPLVGRCSRHQFGYLPGMLWILISPLGGGVTTRSCSSPRCAAAAVARPDAEGGQPPRRHHCHDQPINRDDLLAVLTRSSSGPRENRGSSSRSP
jgi:hypothetical protein